MQQQQFKHTDACEQCQARQRQARADYLARWAQACQACGASGMMGSSDPCEVCLGRCPRCGQPVTDEWYETEQPCPHPECGWNWGRGEGDLMPPAVLDCDCGEIVDLGDDRHDIWLLHVQAVDERLLHE